MLLQPLSAVFDHHLPRRSHQHCRVQPTIPNVVPAPTWLPCVLGNHGQRGRMQEVFRHARGYMGLGPSGMRPGDLICVFLGAPVPWVTRQERQGIRSDRANVMYTDA